MGDVGMKVSQPGKDVKRAGDVDLLFSSSWPSLPIAKEGWVDVELKDDTTPFVAEHDLGYTPLAIFFDMRNHDLPHANNLTGEAGQSKLGKRQHSLVNLISYEKKIEIYNGAGGGYGTMPKNSFYYYIFELDIKTAYQAESIDLGAIVAGGTGDYGIKASVDGKSTSDNAIHEHTIHSATRSPMVHSVGYERSERSFDGSAFHYGHTFFHDLPYNPIYFAYISDGAGMRLVEDRTDLSSEIFGSVTTGLQSLTVDYIDSDIGKYGDKDVSLILFKDPFEVGEKEVINYA